MYIGYYQLKTTPVISMFNPSRYIKCFQHNDEDECIRETSKIATNNNSKKIRIDFLENGKSKVSQKMFIQLK